ncbi:RcnB family protein [Pseudoxanthomonas winnipegensis]|uniref:RcnB family protein n=1 Tax=Pseudoxanthomonas winnipegensis TaxID=2480810 RepID=UPI0030F477D4
MKRLSTLFLSLSLVVSGAAMAAPQHHDDRHDDRRGPPPPARHHDAPHHWSRGEHLGHDHRGVYVRDYRIHHLPPPPRGHQWRRVDNDYVLVAVATGIITSVIAASH